MTSFLIKAHVDRPASVWGSNLTSDENCTFCKIIERSVDAAVVYETDRVIAILDILPLRPGHTLVIPKTHCSRVSELPAEYARAVGEAVSVVAKALTEALENTGLNVVCNQEYAQAVPHVHYHVIPAPIFASSARHRFRQSRNLPAATHHRSGRCTGWSSSRARNWTMTTRRYL